MGSRRGYLVAVALNGFIYVMGGVPEGVGPLDAAEEYELGTDQWHPIASMNSPVA